MVSPKSSQAIANGITDMIEITQDPITNTTLDGQPHDQHDNSIAAGTEWRRRNSPRRRQHQNLSHIFQFYCSQQNLSLGRAPTFQHITEMKGLLSQVGFIKMIKDFNLDKQFPIDKICEVFNQVTEFSRQTKCKLNFDTFERALAQLF